MGFKFNIAYVIHGTKILPVKEALKSGLEDKTSTEQSSQQFQWVANKADLKQEVDRIASYDVQADPAKSLTALICYACRCFCGCYG